jgi:SAM-dependent methyltransferase
MDIQLISAWAGAVDGEIIDAGCGPGHWTNFLAEKGHHVRGVDAVPEFISHARNAYPDVGFTLGNLESLDVGAGSMGGILSWYSLIHHEPETIRVPLREFGRALRPRGTLLIPFFEGPAVEQFAHAVTPAYRWPVDDLGAELTATGFEVVESHVRKTAGQRPLASIVARRLAL